MLKPDTSNVTDSPVAWQRARLYALLALLLVRLVLMAWMPLTANLLGFLPAFKVSYWGHRLKTFNAGAVSHTLALPRFFLVACLGFALNEAVYFLLLRFTQLDYRPALLLVLAAVAALTFLLGRLWAFQGAHQS
ncbi:GtrA-like protein [compost metagenome]